MFLEFWHSREVWRRRFGGVLFLLERLRQTAASLQYVEAVVSVSSSAMLAACWPVVRAGPCGAGSCGAALLFDASHGFDAWARSGCVALTCAGRQGSLRPALQLKMAERRSARRRGDYGLRDVHGGYGTAGLPVASRTNRR